ncbi:MAG: hypothetical protein M5U26_04290 [Planctomycetota bacterium]|nr:hypothetical protein [Planctomycetota bacterium]
MSGGHANCDRCGADLLGASVRYVARFELKQGYDAMEVSPQDLRRDLKGELRAVLRELEGLSDAEVREAEDATALAVYWDLCAACAKDVRAGMKREKGISGT